MKKKVMFIAPYQGLANIINGMEMPQELGVSVQVGNLDEGVELAIEAEQQGYDLIISRGGTATQIEEIVSIPVLHIEITGYDILRIFAMITGIDTKVALVGFPNISEGAATICSILEYDVNLVTINSQTEVEETLCRLKDEGYSVVIGDVVTVTYAKKVGLQGILLTSGKEAVSDSLKAGIRMFELLENNQSKYMVTQNLFDSIPLPTAVLNRNKEIVYHNKAFFKNLVHTGVTSKAQFDDFLDNIDENQDNFYYDEKNNISFMAKTFSIQHEENMQGILIKSIEFKTNNDIIQKENVNENPNIIGVSVSAKKIKELINVYSENEEVISIIGEIGTGKRTVAKAIHFRKHGADSPFYRIDILKFNKHNFSEIKHQFENIFHGSIMIENAEKISTESLRNVLEQIRRDIQVFISIDLTENCKEENNISPEHLKLINNTSSIHLPPLRQRADDIKYFLNYYLSELNAQRGVEILGIKEDALDILQQCFWSGNIIQLKQLISEISFSVQSHYIELKDVEFLKMDSSLKNTDEITVKIGDLKDIERQIIQKVMERENGNQSKTAKILGINRSTLWRKTNE